MTTNVSPFNLHEFHDFVGAWTERFFQSVGLYVAKKPWRTLLISLLVACSLSACTLLGQWEVRYDYREVMRKEDSFKMFDEVLVPKFGSLPRNADMIVQLSDSVDSDNILEKSKMLDALALHTQVLNLSTSISSDGSGVVSYQDVCHKMYENGPCSYDSAFVRLGITPDDIQNMTQDEIDKKFTTGAFLPDLSLNYVVGGLEVTEQSSGKVKVKATSLRFMHWTTLPAVKDSKRIYSIITGKGVSRQEKDTLEWEGAYLNFTCSGINCPPRSDGLVIIAVAGRALVDELNRTATSSTVYMVMALSLILIIMWFMLGGIPCQHSRLSLGVGAVLVIMLSMSAGFGLVSILQIPLTELSLLLIFVVVGIGVDDVIVVVDFVKRQASDLPLEERIANGIGRAGPTIFLTSLTNLLAFLIASNIDYPGVRWFCLAAGIILFILFILTVTLFAALLTLDERRMKKRKFDCLCCVTYEDSSSNEDALNEDVFDEDEQGRGDIQGKDSSARYLLPPLQKHYFRFISNKGIATFIVCGFLSMIPIGFGFSARNVTIGVNFADYFPDGSYYVEFTNAVQSNFASLAHPASIIFQSIDASDPTVQDQVKSLLSDLEEEDFIIKPHASWLADYETYAYDHNKSTGTNNTLPISGEGYYEALQSYLQITDRQCAQRRESGECVRYVIPAVYAKDIAFSRNSNVIKSVSVTQLKCEVQAYERSVNQMKFMDKHREKLAVSLKLYDSLNEDDCMVWSWFYMFFDRDKKMRTLLTKTLVFAAIAILGTLLFFFHPILVLTIALAIASIDGALFTVMYLWGVPIDAVSFVVLAMSIGLSIDYIVHMGHAYGKERGIPSVRLQKVLSGIGISVAKGGLSTFAGIIALAFAPAQTFRTFFQLLFSTVILGMFAGLVFFPACTVILGDLL